MSNTISDIFGLRRRAFKRDGSRWQELIGVELELEGLRDSPDIPYWERKADNSLRSGVEYVLDQPYAGPSLEYALDSFYDERLVAENTQRTSTHIHINMTDATVDAVRSMTMIMYMIEDALFAVVGEGRKWAGYSMALSEMDPVRLRLSLSAADYVAAAAQLAPARNQERYYGFNTASLRRHGTVEFRYFPGGPSRAELENWLDLVVAVKRAAMDNPPDVLIDRINSTEDVVAFLSSYLSDYWLNSLLRAVNTDYMLYKFNTVAALACDPEVAEHRDNLVFLSPTFTNYVKRKFLKDEGRRYLDDVIKEVKVTTPADWYAYLDSARHRDNAPPLKSPKMTKKFNADALSSVYENIVSSSNPFATSTTINTRAPRSR